VEAKQYLRLSGEGPEEIWFGDNHISVCDDKIKPQHRIMRRLCYLFPRQNWKRAGVISSANAILGGMKGGYLPLYEMLLHSI